MQGGTALTACPTQRRTFQLRFQHDLQAALESGVRPRASEERPRSMYEPPPMYSEGQPTEETKRAHQHASADDSPAGNAAAAADVEAFENLAVIRETLYSALADVMVETPSILAMLARGREWTSKAFFASTCLAILSVALTRVDADGVRTVRLGRGSPTVIGLHQTPAYLQPFLGRLVEVSQAVRALAEADDARALQEASEGIEKLTPPKLDRLKERLTLGVGAEETLDSSSQSTDAEVFGLANAINTLALGTSRSVSTTMLSWQVPTCLSAGMTSPPAFRERQAQAFQVLMSVTAL